MAKKRFWLVSIRALCGLKQKDVAEACGITQAEYCQIENGIRNPRVITAMKIANVLGFEWARFFEEVA